MPPSPAFRVFSFRELRNKTLLEEFQVSASSVGKHLGRQQERYLFYLVASLLLARQTPVGSQYHSRHPPYRASEIILVYVVCQGKWLSGGGFTLSTASWWGWRQHTWKRGQFLRRVIGFSQDDFYKDSKGKFLLHSCNRLYSKKYQSSIKYEIALLPFIQKHKTLLIALFLLYTLRTYLSSFESLLGLWTNVRGNSLKLCGNLHNFSFYFPEKSTNQGHLIF